MKIGLYAGSFDPFTYGHKEIVEKALLFCDIVLIGIGDNASKLRTYSKGEMEKAVSAEFSAEVACGRIVVKQYSGLTGDFALKENATLLIRGIRNAGDLKVEEDFTVFNRKVYGLETVFIMADKYPQLSSTLVKEVIRANCDAGDFIPPKVLEVVARNSGSNA